MPKARRPRRGAYPNLSSDWYWEQDAELRFTRVEPRSGDPAEQALASQLVGKLRWESGIEIEGGWDEHRARLAVHLPFENVLMWRELADGSRRYILVSGEPMFDARGRFTGYRGIGRDVTAQKRVERLLRLEHRVMRRLSERAAPEQVLARALQAVGETENWDCAELWKLDARAGALRRFAAWFNDTLEEARAFIDGSQGVAFAPGEGLVGAAWRSGEPLWIADARNDARTQRAALVQRTGLHAAVLFPVWVSGKVEAVLSLTSREMRPPHKRLQQALHVVASMIGQYLERTGAEQALRESEARFRSLTNLSSDWYWEQDTEYRFTRIEGPRMGTDAAERFARLLGQRRWEAGLDVEGGWERHRALLDSRASFHDVLMWRELEDGSLRYIRVSGEPVLAADGIFAGYRGVGRDVSAQHRAEQLLKLEHKVAHLLAAAADASVGLRDVLRAVCEAENWACGRYFDLDERAQMLRFQDGWSVADPAFERFIEGSRRLVFGAGDGLAGRVLQTGEPVWTLDGPADARVREKSLAVSTGIRGIFLFPAVTEGRTVGVLSFGSPKLRRPDPRLLETSRVLGSQIGQFLQRCRAEQALRGLAYHDALTGLANRTSLGPSLEQAVLRARRRHSKVAAVFIDLDGFKPVNDAYGHDAGDAVLIETAARLRKHLRASDFVARLGGDEFVVVLEEVQDLAQVEIVARKLLGELMHPHLLPQGAVQITASVGISVLPDDAPDTAALMKHADMAMYAAKQAGKNTVRFYAGQAANEPAPAVVPAQAGTPFR